MSTLTLSARLVAIGLLIAVPACGGRAATSVRGLPTWTDDVARALRTSDDEAVRVVRATARQTSISEQQIARIAVQQADDLRRLRSRALDFVDDLSQAAGSGDDVASSVILGALCETLVQVREGTAPTPESVYMSIALSAGKEWAEHLWNLGWVTEVLELTRALASGDTENIELVIAEAVYCSGV